MAYKEIPLSRGKVTIVDEADYEWLTQWKWCVMKSRDTEQEAARAYNQAAPVYFGEFARLNLL